MDDRRREMIKNRVTPIELYQQTPKTNCKECGYPTCLAFATQAVVGEASMEQCPYLDQTALAPLRTRLEAQLDEGIGRKRESFEKTLEFLREEIAKCDLVRLAPSLGAEIVQSPGDGPGLRFPYLDDVVLVTSTEVISLKGRELNPWEKIFIYNYVIGGAVEPSGEWVGMESLPNSVSKIKSLRAHCEEPLARAFPRDRHLLEKAASNLFVPVDVGPDGADWAGECRILPRVSIRILWWAEDPEDDFPARVKFLFDSRILETLDLESLLFACERVTDRLLESAKR